MAAAARGPAWRARRPSRPARPHPARPPRTGRGDAGGERARPGALRRDGASCPRERLPGGVGAAARPGPVPEVLGAGQPLFPRLLPAGCHPPMSQVQARLFWESADADRWRAALAAYPAVIVAQGVAELVQLDTWYRTELPAVLAQRSPAPLGARCDTRYRAEPAPPPPAPR